MLKFVGASPIFPLCCGVMQLRKRTSRAEAVTETFKRVGESVKSFDFYPKLKEDHKAVQQTTFGAIVTIISGFVIFVLICSEVGSYLTAEPVEQMMVDPTLGQRLSINFDMTFHALHCGEVNLDAMDVAGEQQNGVKQDIVKTRLSKEGVAIEAGVRVQSDKLVNPKSPDFCGNCYGAESDAFKCCNSCDDLVKAYEHKGWNTASLGATEQCKDTTMGHPGEGCHIAGHLEVNKVAGNFHVAMGQTHSRDNRHIHQFNPSQIPNYNISHTIHRLYFGEEVAGRDNPLDNHKAIATESTGVYQYFMKLVPVRSKARSFLSVFKSWKQSCLYSVTSAFRPAVVNGQRQQVLPGAFWVYDLSPFVVVRLSHSMPFFEFLTGLLAILGGVITVAGMVHSVGFHLIKNPTLLSPSSLAAKAKLGTE